MTYKWTRERHETMIIVRIKQGFKMYSNNFPIPIFLQTGERYMMSEYVMHRLREVTSKKNIKEEKGEWSFKKLFRCYDGEDLTNKTLLAWRTGGIGDFCWIGAGARVLKHKYPGSKFIMGCSQQYRPLIDVNYTFDETFTMPLNAKLLKRAHYHCTFENAVENNPRAESLNCYDLMAERLFINVEDPKEYPVKWKKPYLKPSDEAVKILHKLWKTIGLDTSAMKIGVQVKTSSPIRTPDFQFMMTLIKFLKDKWPESYIFIFGSPAPYYIDMIDDGVKWIDKPRVINWMRLVQDLSLTIALVKDLDLTIAPDSAINHISAAFNIPNVGIFGPFKPEMRLSTYPYSDWVRFDYEKWKGCDLRPINSHTYKSKNFPDSPCWQHSDDSCEFSQKKGIMDHAICLDDITVFDIMKKVDKVLDRKKRGVPRWHDV